MLRQPRALGVPFHAGVFNPHARREQQSARAGNGFGFEGIDDDGAKIIFNIGGKI